MKRLKIACAVLIAAMCTVLAAGPAQALITRLTPLKDVVEESQFILTAKVESVDADKPVMVLAVDEQLKGKAPFKKLVVHLKGDAEANKGKQTPELLKRVAPRLPLVLFVSQRDTTFIAFAYTNGTWFQMTGIKDDDSDHVRWSFTHLEPYLRRTFKGTTAELQKAVSNYLNDKKPLPDTDPKEKPGLGPEVEQEKKDAKPDDEKPGVSRATSGRPSFGGTVARGPVFGVIPAVVIGGPLAMLAMLFPSVFGGWKRWLTLLSVACTNSTLYSLQYFFSNELSGTVWGRSSTLWIAMSLVTLAGTVWAFQRHCVLVMEGEAPFSPSRVELAVLGIVSLIGLGIFGYVKFKHQSVLSPEWMPVVPYCIAAWGAALYVIYAYFVPRRLPALATEAVMLTIMAFATICLMTVGQRTEAGPAALASESQPHLVWQFKAPAKGSIISTPVVAGDRVYIGVAHDDVFNPYGTLYCLDRATGAEFWHFDNNKTMRQVYSTPCVVGDRLYIGEGLHQDAGCRLYCLNADTGVKVWEFGTESHTESSPCVVDGKVYFGAGDDGVYCVDAATGAKLWNFPGYHIDTSPDVSGKRVFAGAGVGDLYKEPAILCLDAETGAKEWLVKTGLPAWGSPTVAGDRVYFGLGNGRLNERDPNPAGALLCVRANDGSQVWQHKTGDSVLCKAEVDALHVYIGACDDKVFCLSRKTGKLCWQSDLGSPVVASPALMSCPCGEGAQRAYVLGSDGYLMCFEANSGRGIWSLALASELSSPVELVSPVVLAEAAGQRRLYVGATLLSTARTAVLCCYEE
jgi:outer membrane protein assembly factor BamB